MNKLFLLVPLAFSLAACEPADRKQNPPKDKNIVSDATDVQEQQIKQNRADLTSGATKQKENEADRTITQDLRRAILDNSNFSMKAKNITIATKNGVVTLRGTVATTKERSDIASKARGLRGVTTVENFLEVTNTK